jgi:23S rRNA (adenine2503-C2)-methyltransferase
VNLIEYNPVEGDSFKRSDPADIDAFVRYLESKNMLVHVRRSRGKDIDAACGQLANKNK